VAAVLLLGAGGGVIYLAWFASPPAFDHPDFWEALLEANPVMGFVRLAIMAGALYAVVSVVALTSRRQWLSRAGPFQVEDTVEKLSAKVVGLRAHLEELERTISDLRAEHLRRHGPDATKR